MEIQSLDQLDALLALGTPLAGSRLQGLDLAAREEALLAVDPHGAVVLGGTLTDRLDAHLRRGGALVFPAVTGAPINPYRAQLYSPEELYEGLDQGYAATADWRAYSWWLDPDGRTDVFATMLRAVHDDSVSDALSETLLGRRVVGVMGGHALGRGDPTGVRRAAFAGYALAMATQSFSALVLLGGHDLVVALYTSDAAVAALASSLLLYAAAFQYPDGVQVLSAGALRGLKDTRVPMFLAAFAYWGIGMPLGAWLGLGLGWGPRGMWIGLIAGLTVAAFLLGRRFLRSSAVR